MYLNANIKDFLVSKHVNVSALCDDAMLHRATELGYLNIDAEIGVLKARLAILKHFKGSKAQQDQVELQFQALFKVYLEQNPRSLDQVRAWLLGPANREYSSIIGHPKDLSVEKIKNFMAEAVMAEGE